ncbi:LysE family translocator [Aliamphritea hakodatensis]|uniref:LysE family translocator n=1 Tax=Aliamphritea hakodatensis TaxID=2895352 RepID=UPI0022FDB02B|nr:LysE family translocator [Aliamphritea hakodatensis]
MSLITWLSLVAVCCLGAMSPGPSLAVVLRHALSNSTRHAVVAALSHAIGVAMWAMLTIWGLAVLVVETPQIFQVITYVGAAYLAWLGIKALRSKGGQMALDGQQVPVSAAAWDGLMVSVLNPKLAVFFIALFSQFVSADLLLADKLIMLSTVTVIDSGWYILLTVLLARTGLLTKMQKGAATVDKVSGVVLLGLALKIAI